MRDTHIQDKSHLEVLTTTSYKRNFEQINAQCKIILIYTEISF